MLPSWPTAEARELQTPDPPAGVPHRCQKRDFLKSDVLKAKCSSLVISPPPPPVQLWETVLGGLRAEDMAWDTCPTVELHLASWGQNNDTEKSQSLVWGQVG